jgi:hypothetical protein
MLGTIVDFDALWHLTLYSLLGTIALTGSYGTLVLALERIGQREQSRGGLAWWALAVLAGAVCVAAVVLGLWAMTKK